MKYCRYNVLELTAGIHDLGGMKWELFGCLVAAWVIVFLCICKGVKSSGKGGICDSHDAIRFLDNITSPRSHATRVQGWCSFLYYS